jgi:hypothetical protein
MKDQHYTKTRLLTCVFTLFIIFTTMGVPAQLQQAPVTDVRFQYAAKIVCGDTPPVMHAQPIPVAANGRYFTQINIHNPSRYYTVNARKKFVLAPRDEKPGKPSDFFSLQLQPDWGTQIDCGNVWKHLQMAPYTYIDGFAIIESPFELDVVGVYTAGTGTQHDVSSIHIERVPVRRMPCAPMMFNLTTGFTPWQVVGEQIPSGPVPRPATVYSNWPGVGGSLYIGALPNQNTNQLRWWDFQICFCLCDRFENTRLNISALAVDDKAEFWLNNNSLGLFPTVPVATINQNATQYFQAGQNCLKVKLTNTVPGQAGFSLAGSVNGDAACSAQP